MIRYYPELVQGSDEWFAARCGLLTASEMKLILTPKTLAYSSSEKERSHLYELLAQRITGYVEPHYVSDDMLRGQEDEIEARMLYEQHYAQVEDMGFITNDRWGFTIGYSPDGIVGDDGLIECKSRRQKFQVETIVENIPAAKSPEDFSLQLQTGLLVSEREWIDFISFSGGQPMVTIRAYPDEKVQKAIVEAAGEFEKRLSAKRDIYNRVLQSKARLIPTERKIIQEMYA